MLNLHAFGAQGKFAVMVIGECPHLTWSHPLTSRWENQGSERAWALSGSHSAQRQLAPPEGGSLGAGFIVLSPAGNRCAQQPGLQERRNEFGYVTGRPSGLSQAQR